MKRIAFFFCLCSGTAWAQTDTTLQKDTIDLAPVEVQAVRAGSTAPFAKTNLTRAAIEEQNLGQDLPFLLNQTPSVVVNSDAGTGVGYTGIRIRGTDATRINVTLNGVPFNDPESQGTFFVNLPDFSSSVNSIQIQRGVGTSSNGAGAFGASIALSTNEVNRESYAELANSYGSFDTWKNTVRAGTGLLNNHFTVDARLSNITSSGYIDRATSDLKSFYVSTAYLAPKTSVRLNVFSGKEKTYQAWYGVSESDLKTNRKFNSAGTARPGSPYENETDNYTQTHYQLFYNQQLAPTLILNTGFFYVKGKGYYEQYRGQERYSKYGLPDPTFGTTVISKSDFIRQLWLDNDFYGNIFSLQHQANKTQITLGGAITNYLGNHFGNLIWAQYGLPHDNYRWYDNDGEKSDFSLYTKWQQNLTAALQLFADVQYRGVDYSISGFRDSPGLSIDEQYHFVNPKLGLSYSKANWLLFASYSIANKEPNRDDFEAGASELPRPERLSDVEIGLEKKTSNFNWGANLYYMSYKDQLVLTGKINDVGAYTRTNIDDSYRLGVELQGTTSITPWLGASGNLALSRNRIKNFTEFVDDYDNGGQKTASFAETDISFSPNVVGAATLTVKPVQALEVSFIGKYVGKQYLDNTQSESRKLDPYYTQDIRAIYSFRKKALKNFSLIAQVSNVFNKLYEPNGYTYSYYYGNQLTTENFYFPMAGINWSVGVNIKL